MKYTFDPETGDGLYYERNRRASTETAFVTTYWDINGELTVFDGGNRWTVESDHNAWRSPIVVGDALTAGHFATPPEHVESDYPERSLVAFNIADGSDRWILDFDEELPDAGGRPIAADENTLYLETVEALVALRASDADDAEPDGDGSADDDDSANDDPVDEDDDSDNEDDGSGVGEDDGDAADDGDDDPDANGGEDEIDGDGDETTDDEDDAGDDVPGFTTGAGIVGGALGLEWLRRKASVDEPTGGDEPAE
ncbi:MULTISPECIES: hypothetical protein [Natrialbaceae]|uniref:hypothetical protein n=1 Tax=Natrialbaceae TaxID=1644061 RepID=UPI00207C2AAA|nr:hypothetical protein [Natronococcus sp. CG52]